MIKILYVNSSARLYGADKSLLELATCMHKEYFAPIILLPEYGPLFDEIHKIGVEALVSHFVHAERRYFSLAGFIKFILSMIGSIRNIITIIRQRNIDCVHSNTSACIASAIAAKLTRTPHIWHIRELTVKPKVIRIFYQLFIPLLADKVIAASQVVKDNYCTGWNSLNSKLLILPHGVDTDRLANAKSILRSEYSIPSNHKIVGNVGMLRSQKGQHLLLEAAKLVKDRYANVNFVIVGDMFYEQGKIAPDLVALCNNLGLSDCVIFTGFRNDIEDVLASFDIFVHCSVSQEAYGRTILEAMAASKPVVAFDDGGPSELVRNGITGFLVSARDVKAMADKILNLLLDEDLRIQMGKEGKRVIRENYSPKKYIKCLEDIYEQLIHKESQCS